MGFASIKERTLLAASESPTGSGSSRIGINSSFQAHFALESIFDFRLISGLENAVRAWSRRMTSSTPYVASRTSRPAARAATRLMSPHTTRKMPVAVPR